MTKKFIFTYRWCNDLGKIKSFYSGVLGLEPVWDTDEVIAFKIHDHQLSFNYDSSLVMPEPVFSSQLGWEGGTAHRTSWSIECSGQEFKDIVKRAQKTDVKSFYPEPKWVGYWSYPILDPMNETIEVTCTDTELYK